MAGSLFMAEPILLYYGILYLRVNKKGCSDGDEFCGRAR